MLTTDKARIRAKKIDGRDPSAPPTVTDTYEIIVEVSGDTNNSVVRAEVKFDNLENLPIPSANPVHCYTSLVGRYSNDGITFNANAVGCIYAVNVILFNDFGEQLTQLQPFLVTVEPAEQAS